MSRGVGAFDWTHPVVTSLPLTDLVAAGRPPPGVSEKEKRRCGKLTAHAGTRRLDARRDHMRNEKLSCREWLALGSVGMLASVTVACQGGNFPTTPSTITTGMSPSVSSSSLGSTGTLKLAGNGVTGISDISWGNDRSRGRGNDARRRIAYCRGLTEGHKRYERCQAWLNTLENRSEPGRGDRSRKRGSAREQ